MPDKMATDRFQKPCDAPTGIIASSGSACRSRPPAARLPRPERSRVPHSPLPADRGRRSRLPAGQGRRWRPRPDSSAVRTRDAWDAGTARTAPRNAPAMRRRALGRPPRARGWRSNVQPEQASQHGRAGAVPRPARSANDTVPLAPPAASKRAIWRQGAQRAKRCPRCAKAERILRRRVPSARNPAARAASSQRAVPSSMIRCAVPSPLR